MRQISPGELFPITRQLSDPSDASTYYIRAYVRWADSDTLLSFSGNQYINLTDQGDQRFRTTMRVPQDKNGGQGSYLTITTKVFTDSGYSSLATNYEIKEEQYLVFDRRNPFTMGGGGGVNYESIRNIFKEEMGKNKVEAKEPNLQPIITLLETFEKSIKQSIKDIKFPEQEKVNLQPILDAISTAKTDVTKSISDIEFPEPEKVDLSGIESRLDALDIDAYREKMDAMFDRIKEFFRTDIEDIKDLFNQVMTFLKGISFLTLNPGTKTEAEPKKEEPIEELDDEDDEE